MKWFRADQALELASPPAYRYGLPQCFLVAIIFILLAPFYWSETQIRSGSVGEAYANAGLYQITYPLYHHAFERLRNGELPLWNARQLCGTPLLADSRVGLFQPLNAPFLYLATHDALAVNAFLCLFLSGLFFSMFARAGGAGYLASMLGGMVYAFSGMSAIGVSSPQLGAALTWTALLLWAVREFAQRYDTASAMLAGAAGALLILSGAYAFALAGAAVAIAYGAQSLLLTTEAVRFRRRITGLVLMAGIALAVSAVQWIPTLAWVIQLESPLEYLWHVPVEIQIPGSATELFAQLLGSEPNESPRMLYVGIASLALMPAALFHRHRKRDAAFHAIIAAACIVIIIFFGWRLPLRFPLPALVLPIVISAAALVSIGADRVFIPRRTFRSPSVWLPVLIVLIASGTLFYAFGAEVRRYVLPLAAVVLMYAPLRLRGLTALSIVLVGSLLLIDFVHANRTVYTHPRQDAPECFETYAQAVSAARDQALGGRVLVSARDLDRGLSGNLGMLSDLYAVGGVGFPLTEAQHAWWDRMAGPATGPLRASGKDVTPDSPAPELLQFMAARVLIAAPQGSLYEGRWKTNGPGLREISGHDDARLFVFDDALPRAYWSPRARVEVGMAATLDALTAPGFDPRQLCVVDAQSPGITGLAESTRASGTANTEVVPEATCSVENLSPEHVIVRVDAVQDGVTVLADMYAPGWTATLNGKRQSILKVNGLFRGVATPAGPHVIEFRYRPWSVYIGLGVSGLALAALLLTGLRALGRPTTRAAMF